MEDYTIILNYYNKSINLMRRQMDAVRLQSVQPKKVLTCFLGLSLDSQHIQEYIKYIEENDCKNWNYIISDYNFKYIGRYQVALNVDTDYIVMLDDDRIPSEFYCESMVKFAKKSGGIIQQYGWILKKDNNGEYSDGNGLFLSPLIDKKFFYKISKNKPYVYVDYLCGGMVFHKNHLINLFNEPLDTNITGEDIIFCLKSKLKSKVPVLCYYPFLDKEGIYFGKRGFLGHDSEGISSTLDKNGMIKSGIIKQTRDFLINKYIIK